MAEAVERSAPPEVAQTLGEYFGGWTARLRNGESRVLPVLAGLMLITVLFQATSPNHVFLSATNLVNLFQQSAVFMVLAMAEAFALLLGEIDLSVGYVAAIGGVIGVQLVQPTTTNWPWWAAVVAALLVCALIGAIQGTLVARVGLPSFVVTLAGLMILNGLMLLLLLLGPFSGYPSLAGNTNNLHVLYHLMWGTIDPVMSWAAMTAIVVTLSLVIWLRDGRRRRSGLVAPPVGVTIMKIVALTVAAIVVVAICTVNRGAFGVVDGVPWIIPLVLAVVGVWSVLLQQTKFGRYVYAIGGNAEAARRAGIDVALVRTLAFTLCSLTAGIGGLLYASYLGGMSNNVNGGQLVLYAVAAAVIGGTSLFGGRGRVIDGVLGGLVIGSIYNGMGLLGLNIERQLIITGFVLLAAIFIDTLSRRGAR